jgi:hypothetical protein
MTRTVSAQQLGWGFCGTHKAVRCCQRMLRRGGVMTLAALPPASAAAAAPCCRQMHRCCRALLPEPPRWLRSAPPGDSRGCGCRWV